jgi:hypothetical protein
MKRTATAPALPNIVAAMSDTRLFGGMYEGPTWDGWKVVLKAAFGLPMTAEEIASFKIVAGDRDPSGRRCKELVLAIGRRGGKDAISALICAHAAMCFRSDGRVRAGERPLILLLAADRSQARNLLRYVRALFEVPPLKAMIQRETQDGFELANGIDVFVGTADWRTIRGRTILLAVLNELSFWRDETSSNPDKEIYRAIVPATATLGEQAMVVMISSVHRRAGLLYEKWSKHYGASDPNVLVVMGGTRQFNPTIDQQIIDDALADDPQAAAAEYLSTWRDDLASFLTRPEIEACIDRGVTSRQPRPDVQYTAWVDASSGSGKDSMCCAIGHAEGDVSVIDHIIEIVPPFAPPDAVTLIASALRNYGITRAGADKWALGFTASEFERHRITLDYSSKPRSDIYREARPIIASRRARLLDSDRMTNQFCNLERRAMPGGGERIDHPQRGGHHDDVAVVVAGCLVALATPVTGAEAFLEFMRRQVEEPWRFRHSTDHDAIRAPGPPNFGWNLASEPLVRVVVPPVIAAEGSVNNRSLRRIGDQAVAEMTRGEARGWLENPEWRKLNQDLAKELFGEDAR